jgi:hypothetical protein
MTPLDLQCTMLLQTASSTALGLVVVTNDPIRARATLYRVRRTLDDPTLASLQIRVSPDNAEHEIWLVRRDQAPGFDLKEAFSA